MDENNTTVNTETADSSTETEVEQAASTSDTGAEDVRIPKFRFDKVNTELKSYKERTEALEQQLKNYIEKSQPAKEATESRKFKEQYTSLDEFYKDFTSMAASDDTFLDAFLDALYQKKGDKFDEAIFNSLTRKQQRIAQETEDITRKMEQENDQKLDRIEAAFGTDAAGYTKFRDWVESVVVDKDPKDVPTWARDLDSLYDVYKSYIYKKPETSPAARAISRSRSGGKVAPQVDESGDIGDILRRAAARGAITN